MNFAPWFRRIQLVVSALRATDAEITGERGVLQVLRSMGQLPYMASPPTGYPHASEDWVNSAAMLARMNFGIDLATGRIPGVVPRNTALPFVPSPVLAQAIAADIAMQTATTSSSVTLPSRRILPLRKRQPKCRRSWTVATW